MYGVTYIFFNEQHRVQDFAADSVAGRDCLVEQEFAAPYLIVVFHLLTLL